MSKCPKCDNNFMTQYAFINDGDKKIYVNDYEKCDGDKIRCSNGHELVMVNCEKRRNYFRHKNVGDTSGNMSEWHSKWQGYFPNTEVNFKSTCDNQVKSRRADILIEKDNVVIEIQHSNIDRSEVLCRDHDYKVNNLDEVIWVIDGNTDDIKCEVVKDGGYFITFKDSWKYESFTHCYDFILLDIKENIFKIPVKKICSNMIYVRDSIPIDKIVNLLNNEPKDVWGLWNDDNEILPKLTIKQKGAGNGKTFDIWKDISINWSKYTNIVITKQHTAKEVIKAELDDQATRNDCNHINDNMDELDKDLKYKKQLIVEYQHKITKKKHTVIIGTIDSFMCGLSYCNNTTTNFFDNLLDNIDKNGCNNVKNGSIKYAGRNIKLDKTTELTIDEAQDLGKKYYKAILKLMLLTKIDVIVVGDLLQSLEHLENFMNICDKTSGIIINKDAPVNINRRIKVKHMGKKINQLVNFPEYSVPEINIEAEDKLEDYGEDVIESINEPTIYADNNSKGNIDKISKYVDTILKLYNDEVRKYCYTPSDFLIIFPIMKGNLLACELETRINDYWIDNSKDNDEYNDEYKQYAVLHRHQEGQPIDTKSSKNATRIMSLRASKGDGRKVVFILGCNERSLKLCSNGEIKLLYESHFHVALTRSKYKIYYGLQENGDDIHRRFGSNGYVAYKPNINISYRINRLIENIDTDKIINILKKNGIKVPVKTDEKKESLLIDWEYHCIRRAIYFQYAIFCILNKNKNNNNFGKSQIKKVLDQMIDLPIKERAPKKFYDYLNSLDDFDNLEYFPLCNFSHKKPAYRNICKIIGNTMVKLHNDYKKDPLSLADQTPLEAVIQNYMIEVIGHKKYHQTTPMTIYNIVDNFETQEGTKITELLKEAQTIKEITKKVMDEIMNNNSGIQWNIEHMIKYGGHTEEFKLLKPDFPIIGFDNENVYHIMMKTDFSELNYWETLIEILLERFLLYNPSDKGKDIIKFEGKKIKTFIFILKKNDYVLFEWDWDKDINQEIKEEIKDAIVKDLCSHNKEIFQYYQYIKSERDIYRLCGDVECQTPLEFMKEDFKQINYLTDFYSWCVGQSQRSSQEKENIKKLLNDENEFNEELKKRINNVCNIFLGLNKYEIYEEEW